MGFWDVNDITAARMNRLGPHVDEVVGTDGNYQSINAAIAAGAKRLLLAPGATLTSGLTISVANGFIVHLGHPRDIVFAKQLVIAAANWHLEGFTIDGAIGSGIVHQPAGAGRFSIHRVHAVNCGIHGIHLNGGGQNDVPIVDCECNGNTVDGIRIETGYNTARINGCMSWGNGGWGIKDNATTGCIATGNRLDNNTSGAISGHDTEAGNKKT